MKNISQVILVILLFSNVQFSLADVDPILTGKWQGVYYGCGQEVPTQAEIDVYENLNAVFRFYASDSKFGEFEGIFHGTIERDEDSVIFKPISNEIAAWFIKPTGIWTSIGFDAILDKSNRSMTGNVTSLSIGGFGGGCSIIRLTKANECEAIYDNGQLQLPCVKVTAPSGQVTDYEAKMEYQPLSDPITFQLTEIKEAP